MQLTYDENMDIINIKCFLSKRTGYTLPPGIHQITDIKLMLKCLLPNEVKVTVNIDDIGIKSNLKIIQTLFFTGKSFLNVFRIYSITFLCFRRYRWILSNDCGVV